MLEELIKKVNSLNMSERQQFISWLNGQLQSGNDLSTIPSVIEIRKDSITKKGIVCPHCKSTELGGHGVYKGRKRYRCKNCKRTFNDFSGTAIDRIHNKDKWKEYLPLMMKGLSLRAIAKQMNINLRTSFKWRHRILSSLNEVGCAYMEGIIEADETFFLYSEKGNKKLNREPRKRGSKAIKDGMNMEHVNVIAAADRRGNRALNVGNRGVVTKEAIKKAIGKWINNPGNILCSDAHRTFQGYAKENKMIHKMLYARKKQHVIEGIYHIQHVNNLHSLLKKFFIRFNGVASKYLQNYVNYFKAFSMITNSDIIYPVLADNNVYYGTYKTNLHYYAT
jgi:transposase-like protein